MKILAALGMRSVVVMPNRLRRVHPFVSLSFLTLRRGKLLRKLQGMLMVQCSKWMSTGRALEPLHPVQARQSQLLVARVVTPSPTIASVLTTTDGQHFVSMITPVWMPGRSLIRNASAPQKHGRDKKIDYYCGTGVWTRQVREVTALHVHCTEQHT